MFLSLKEGNRKTLRNYFKSSVFTVYNRTHPFEHAYLINCRYEHMFKYRILEMVLRMALKRQEQGK